MKKTIIILALALFNACSHDPIEELFEESENAETRAIGDGLYDALGYGYDCSKSFVESVYLKRRIFNVEKFLEDYPNDIDIQNIFEREGKSYIGRDSYEYTYFISKEYTSNFILFGGDLSRVFSSTVTNNYKNSFARHDEKVIFKRMRINLPNHSSALLRQYADSTFLRDLDSGNINSTIANYGTHVLLGIEVGAKFRATYKSVVKDESKQESLESGFGASMQDVFGISTSTTITTSLITNCESQTIIYKTFGGDPTSQLSGTLNLGESNRYIDINPWLTSINENNIYFIDIPEGGLLIPIYEFIDDSKAAGKLLKALMAGLLDQYIQKTYPSNYILYRFYNRTEDCHRVTADLDELPLSGKNGYTLAGKLGKLLSPYVYQDGMIPIYEYEYSNKYLYSPEKKDYIYSFSYMRYKYKRFIGFGHPDRSLYSRVEYYMDITNATPKSKWILKDEPIPNNSAKIFEIGFPQD